MKLTLRQLRKIIAECTRSRLTEINCKKCGDDNYYAEPNQPDGSFVCRQCRDSYGISEEPPMQKTAAATANVSISYEDAVKQVRRDARQQRVTAFCDEIFDQMMNAGKGVSPEYVAEAIESGDEDAAEQQLNYQWACSGLPMPKSERKKSIAGLLPDDEMIDEIMANGANDYDASA